jgi:hypothetical protein
LYSKSYKDASLWTGDIKALRSANWELFNPLFEHFKIKTHKDNVEKLKKEIDNISIQNTQDPQKDWDNVWSLIFKLQASLATGKTSIHIFDDVFEKFPQRHQSLKTAMDNVFGKKDAPDSDNGIRFRLNENDNSVQVQVGKAFVSQEIISFKTDISKTDNTAEFT